ncbi:MAG: MgtC/SapB family protein [Limisphaerales bacterium]
MPLEFGDIALRIGLAFLSGFILGLERETRGRPAGLRTIVLVCVASAIAAVLSDIFYQGSFNEDGERRNWHPDPARLAAGILTGIGFLGAGVIIQQENWVRGITTASQIWFVTILGLCYGSGQLVLGLVGFIISIITVYFLHKMELVMKRDSYAILTIVADADASKVPEITKTISEMDAHVRNTEVLRNLREKTSTLSFLVRYRKAEESRMPEKMVDRLSTLPGIISVHWK